MKLGGKKEKRKLIAFVLMFLLTTPLTIFYILDGRGVFDTRGRAEFNWEACEYSKADLNKDGIVDMVDFGLWLRHYRDFKENPSDFSAIADLTDSGEIGMSDFAVWLRLWRQYKACQEGLSKGDTSMCLPGCFLVGACELYGWQDEDCGEGNCQEDEMYQTLDYGPEGCQPIPQTTERCVSHDSCLPELFPSPHCVDCSANYRFAKAEWDIVGWDKSTEPSFQECKVAASRGQTGEIGAMENVKYRCDPTCNVPEYYENYGLYGSVPQVWIDSMPYIKCLRDNIGDYECYGCSTIYPNTYSLWNKDEGQTCNDATASDPIKDLIYLCDVDCGRPDTIWDPGEFGSEEYWIRRLNEYNYWYENQPSYDTCFEGHR